MATIDDYGLDMFESSRIMEFAKKLVDHRVIEKTLANPQICLDHWIHGNTWLARLACVKGWVGRAGKEGRRDY